MNKYVIVFFVVASVFLIFTFRPLRDGNPGLCRTADDARKIGVFVCDLWSTNSDVEEAWMEEGWGYSAWTWRIEQSSSPQIRLRANTKGKLAQDLLKERIRMEFNDGPSAGGSHTIVGYNASVKESIYVMKIYNGIDLSDTTVLGEIFFCTQPIQVLLCDQ
jgi:hypothetical protein